MALMLRYINIKSKYVNKIYIYWFRTVICISFIISQTIVHEEDTQALTEPIVVPVRHKKFSYVEQDLPYTSYDMELVLCCAV